MAQFLDNGIPVHVYVDSLLGDDTNEGLTPVPGPAKAGPLRTLGEVSRRLPSCAVNGSLYIVHLASNGSTPQTYAANPVLAFDGLGYAVNPVQIRGPQMVPFVPATGTTTPTLADPPVTIVQQPDAAGTLRDAYAILNFSGSPGWTANDFAGRAFLRIKRGGLLRYCEVSVAGNTASTVQVDTTGLSLLSTDAVEIVQPGAIIGSSDPSFLVIRMGAAIRQSGGVSDGAGASFERVGFSTPIVTIVGGGAHLDRCVLPQFLNQHGARGTTINCCGRSQLVYCTTLQGSSGFLPRRDSAVEPDPAVYASALWGVTLYGPSAGLIVGRSMTTSGGPALGLHFQSLGVSVWGTTRAAVEVSGPGSILYVHSPLLGSSTTYAVRAREGAQVRLLYTSTFIASTGSFDLALETGAGIRFGNGADQLMDPNTWNSNFTRAGESSRIYTTAG